MSKCLKVFKVNQVKINKSNNNLKVLQKKVGI